MGMNKRSQVENSGRIDQKGVMIFLLALGLFAVAIRIYFFNRHQMIEGDGVHYAALARMISREGDFRGAANAYWSNLWPVIIALFDLFVHNLELAGRLASTLFGALMVIPAYLLGRDIFGQRAGLAAAALAAGQPYLLRFSVLLYTEVFFTFILAMALWLGLRLFREPTHSKKWALFGLAVGLGLLTRPEVLATAGILSLASILAAWRRRLGLKGTWKGFGIFCAVLAGFLFLRASVIWRASGGWEFGFGEKVLVNLKTADVYYNGSAYEKTLGRFEDGRFTTLRKPDQSMTGYLWENRKLLPRRAAINLAQIKNSCLRVLPNAQGNVHFIRVSLFFCILGAITALVRKGSRSMSCLLIGLFSFYAIPWLLIFVVDRFVVPLTAFSLLFTAAGLAFTESALARLLGRRRLFLWPSLAFIFILIFTWRTLTWARHDRSFIWENDPVVQKEAGLFLKAEFPQKARILTWGPHVPFYFYDGNPYRRSIQNLPWTPWPDLLAFLHTKKISVLALPEWVLNLADFPYKNLVSETAAPDGLKLIKTIGTQAPHRIWIYQVIHSNAERGTT
jgi:4-amino-4-deoxy-L-arabinose transferase-like glycosyltransferase